MAYLKKRDYAFPDRLARIMAEQDLSKSDVARDLWGTTTDKNGYTVARNRQSISKYLSGKSYPSTDIRRKLSEVLKVPYADLFPLEGPAERPGSGVTLQAIGKGQQSRLHMELVLPTSVALDVIKLVEPYT